MEGFYNGEGRAEQVVLLIGWLTNIFLAAVVVYDGLEEELCPFFCQSDPLLDQ